jgi:hypothetical protein
MSHTFWAGIFVWLACLLTALAFYGRARLEKPVLRKHQQSFNEQVSSGLKVPINQYE